ncbi:uncharacterized protein J3D65DRAFT_550831, partial [Phyllosticta citribraziliensis]
NTTYIYTNTSSLTMGKGIDMGLVVLSNNLLDSRLETLNIGDSNLVYDRE